MFPNYCWVVSGAWRSAAPNANIGDDEQEFEATAATPALALLAAMLKALIARQEETQ